MEMKKDFLLQKIGRAQHTNNLKEHYENANKNNVVKIDGRTIK